MTPVEEALRDARRPRARRQDPLHRLLELLRLAPDEVAGRLGAATAWPRYVAHQAYYSLVGRDYEWELMPLGARPEGVGAVVWSPLGWGRLTGKIRRGQPLPETSRLQSKLVADIGPPVADEYLYRVVDALDAVAKETGKTVPQIALNWLLQRPTVANVIIGARNEEQLRAEPRRGRLEPDAGAGRAARRRQRDAAGLSLLAPARLRRAQPAARLTTAEPRSAVARERREKGLNAGTSASARPKLISFACRFAETHSDRGVRCHDFDW